jgi:hypothetical protein
VEKVKPGYDVLRFSETHPESDITSIDWQSQSLYPDKYTVCGDGCEREAFDFVRNNQSTI